MPGVASILSTVMSKVASVLVKATLVANSPESERVPNVREGTHPGRCVNQLGGLQRVPENGRCWGPNRPPFGSQSASQRRRVGRPKVEIGPLQASLQTPPANLVLSEELRRFWTNRAFKQPPSNKWINYCPPTPT
jgi:hypothetical protein